MIDIQNLSVTLNRREILKDVSFSITSNSCIGVIGGKNSGKSVLIKTILKVFKQSKGNITYEFGHGVLNRVIGICQNEDGVDPFYTVRNICTLYQKSYKVSKNRVNELLELYGLNKLEKVIYRKLSIFEKRKLNLVLALIQDPQILIIDELTTNLGIEERNEIFNLFLELKNTGKIIIYISCYLEESWYLCDELLVLDNGNVVYNGSKDGVADGFEEFKEKIISLIGGGS